MEGKAEVVEAHPLIEAVSHHSTSKGFRAYHTAKCGADDIYSSFVSADVSISRECMSQLFDDRRRSIARSFD
jgi:hypothetical protein